MSLRSAFRAVIPHRARHRLLRLYHLPQGLHARWCRGSAATLPPTHMIKTIGGGDYEAVGKEFLAHFREVGGLTPDDHVLDVGCGVGRMALPLAGYLKPSARYEGFDIVAEQIRWCTENITSRYSHFRFQLSDVYNAWYNPGGKVPASTYRFPFADGEFSFVFLTSVFTHLVGDDFRNYLFEASRVLRRGGRLFGTFFLLNAESEALMRAGKSTLVFRHEVPGGRTTDENAPEAAVAVAEDDVLSLHDRAGLDVRRPIRYGSWCARPRSLSYQDIVLSVRR
jgi:SAM-dependent methyltransferase